MTKRQKKARDPELDLTDADLIMSNCLELLNDIIQNNICDANLSINGIAFQFTISTQKLIWSLDLLNEARSILGAHECGFWSDEDEPGEQSVYFMIYDNPALYMTDEDFLVKVDKKDDGGSNDRN